MAQELTRRQVLTYGAIGLGVAVVGTGAVVLALRDADLVGEVSNGNAEGGGGDTGSTPSSWVEPEVIASVDGILDLDLVVAASAVDLAGESVRMLTFNGTVPGPTMHLRPGDLLRIRLRNELDEPTNLHTHGLLVSADGNSDNPFVHIAPGEIFEYEIELPDDHPSGVFWYHPHHHGMVADQLFGGLYGAIVVDEEDWDAAAPRIVVVSDVTVAAGEVAAVSQMDRMMGRTGETLLVNGQPTPELLGPPGVDQRLLIVNACASRYLDLQFGGLDARLRGIDSGHREPEHVDRLVLMPGNRADVVVAMPAQASDLVTGEFDRGSMGGGMMGGGMMGSAVDPEATVLTLAPDSDAAVAGVADPVPERSADLREATPDVRRTVTLGMSGGGGMRFLIDGQEFAPGRVDATATLGTVEEWTIVNTSAMDHPFHLHIWPMQMIRDASGDEPTIVDLRDVVPVPAESEVVVRIAFDRYPGRTVYHCHILDHEDLGMMGIIEAV